MGRKRVLQNPSDRRMGRLNVIAFVVFVAALTAFLIFAVPRLLKRDVLAAEPPVGCVSFFGDQTAAFDIAVPADFSPAPDGYGASMTFKSTLLLEEMTVPVENQAFETQMFRHGDGSRSMLITGTAELGGLCYYELREEGSGRFLLRQEAVNLSGGGRLMFPCHLDPKPAGTARMEPGLNYDTEGSLAEFYGYYQSSGRYQVELREDSIVLSGYTDLVPASAPAFPGACQLFVTEASSGNTVRLEWV